MRKMLPAFLVTAAVLAFSVWALPQLPARVTTHWGIDGQPNGWSSPAFAALLLPGLMVLMSALFAALPGIDPLRKNYEFHGSVYFLLVNVVVMFLGVVHVLVLGAALGWPVDFRRAMPVLLGLLFGFMGNLLPRIRPNWFMGIRTPWTLSSETVWRKTHRIGGYAFTAAGLVLLAVGLLSPAVASMKIALWVILPMLLWPVIYSYVEWRREKEAATSTPSR
jgi:uncharacterized membrane protein